MRFFTVTMRVGIEDYSVSETKDPSLSPLDAILQTIAEDVPDIVVLDYTETELALVPQELYDELLNGEDTSDWEDIFAPLSRAKLDSTPHPAYQSDDPEVEDAYEDFLVSQADAIKDAALQSDEPKVWVNPTIQPNEMPLTKQQEAWFKHTK